MLFFSTPLIFRRSTKQSSITACRQQISPPLDNYRSTEINPHKTAKNSQKKSRSSSTVLHTPTKTRARRTRTRGGSRRRRTRTRDKNKTSKHKDNGENSGNQSRMNRTRKTVPPLRPPPPLLAQSQMPRRVTITETEKTKQKIGNLSYFALFFNFVFVLVLFCSSFFGDTSGRWIFLFPPKIFF